jgi:ATP phosphoribosyltransferase regulatory subunit HisZ
MLGLSHPQSDVESIALASSVLKKLKILDNVKVKFAGRAWE